MMTPLEYIRDHLEYESLRAIGKCVIIADEAGHHDIAEAAANQLVKMSHGMDALQVEVNELRALREKG